MKENYYPETESDSSYADIVHFLRMEHDLEILNERADDLNEEALDVLDYQVAL